ncbi:MAG: DUF922 domain-containing protein [Bdellovibrionales bacterium]|nr:DUF922 domain-containing protein [Bdellovibrionales bacterium]
MRSQLILLIGIVFCLLAISVYASSINNNWNFNDPLKKHELANIKNLEIKYYPVTGKSKKELRKAINSNGPVDMYGDKKDAYTKWFISWKWPSDIGSVPDFSKTTSQLKIELYLPKWIPADKTSDELKDEWISYYRAMLNHELKHVEIALNNYQNVSKAIRTAADKNQFLSVIEAHKIAKNEVRKIHAADKTYDILSHSGRLEGVKFY